MPILILLGFLLVISYFAVTLIVGLMAAIYDILAKAAFPIAALFNRSLGIPMTQLTSVGVLIVLICFVWGIIKVKRYLNSNDYSNETITNDDTLKTVAFKNIFFLVVGIVIWPYISDYILRNVWDLHTYKVIGYWVFIIFTGGIGFLVTKTMQSLIHFTPSGIQKRAQLKQQKEEAERLEAERRAEEARIRAIKEDNFAKLIVMTADEIKDKYRIGYDSIFGTACSEGEDEGYRNGYNQGYRENC